MSRRRQLAATATLSLVCLALMFVWARSYWRVDKVWAQVLPNYTFKMKVVPGKVTLGCSRSPVTLDVGDGNWFTWPTNIYFAEYIPWPDRPLLGELHLTGNYLTVPLWLPATLALALAATFAALSYHQSRAMSLAPAAIESPAPTSRFRRAFAWLLHRRATQAPVAPVTPALS
jgi:hypothetical protein